MHGGTPTLHNDIWHVWNVSTVWLNMCLYIKTAGLCIGGCNPAHVAHGLLIAFGILVPSSDMCEITSVLQSIEYYACWISCGRMLKLKTIYTDYKCE